MYVQPIVWTIIILKVVLQYPMAGVARELGMYCGEK